MSASLIWMLTRDNNSFLHKVGQTKRDGSVRFSSEPNNLMAVSTQKYSGLANAATVGIAVDASSVTVGSGTATKPASSNKTTALTNATGKSLKKVVEAVKSSRGDLVSAATMRYKRVARASRIQRGLSKKVVKSGARK
jgi:hypothetical protein